MSERDVKQYRRDLEAAEAERDLLRERLAKVEELAKVQAISCRAQHRADHERNWLDVLAIIEGSADEVLASVPEPSDSDPVWTLRPDCRCPDDCDCDGRLYCRICGMRGRPHVRGQEDHPDAPSEQP